MAKATVTITIKFTATHEDFLHTQNIEMGIREAISKNKINIIDDDENVSMHDTHFNWDVEKNKVPKFTPHELDRLNQIADSCED